MLQNTPPSTQNQTESFKPDNLNESPQGVDIISGEYIVVLKDPFDGRISSEIAQQTDLKIDSVITDVKIGQDSVLSKYQYAIRGFAAKLNDKQVEQLKNHSLVDHIGPNYLIPLSDGMESYPVSTKMVSQSVPWGINRVGGPFNGSGKKAWIIDTGIDLDNPDLKLMWQTVFLSYQGKVPMIYKDMELVLQEL